MSGLPTDEFFRNRTRSTTKRGTNRNEATLGLELPVSIGDSIGMDSPPMSVCGYFISSLSFSAISDRANRKKKKHFSLENRSVTDNNV